MIPIFWPLIIVDLSYSKNEVWPKFAKIAKIKELENSEAYLEEGGL